MTEDDERWAFWCGWLFCGLATCAGVALTSYPVPWFAPAPGAVGILLYSLKEWRKLNRPPS